MRLGIIGDELQGGIAGGQRLLGLSASEEKPGTPDLVAGLEGLVGFEADRLLEVRSAESYWLGVMSCARRRAGHACDRARPAPSVPDGRRWRGRTPR